MEVDLESVLFCSSLLWILLPVFVSFSVSLVLLVVVFIVVNK